MRKIDGHVHLLGDGSSGSGCWIQLQGHWRRFLAKTMLKECGLPLSVLEEGGLDQLYLKRLLEQVSASSLDAILLLAHEVPRDEKGAEMQGVGAFYVPNEFVLSLAAKYPEFIPAVAIHPARPDALDELERCIETGARVMKCLPSCQNINCSDGRYERFWNRMAEAGMILLAHTGGEMALPIVSAQYADPRTLYLPLTCGVTVIAAHCAGRSFIFDHDYTDVLLQMLGAFPNLYGDNSALCSPIRSRTLKKILHPAVIDRIIHGSDYPIPVSGFGPWARGRLSERDYRQWQKCPNTIERDYQFKRAMGFREESFTRLDTLLSQG